MKRLLAIIISTMLIATQPAVSMTLGEAVGVAAAYWGPPPCGQPTFEVTDNEALYPAPTIPGTTVVALANPRACRVILKPVVETWGITCVTVAHEYGHLMDLGHSDDPTNIMHAVIPKSWGPCPPPEATPTPAAAPTVRKKAVRRTLCTGARCRF